MKPAWDYHCAYCGKSTPRKHSCPPGKPIKRTLKLARHEAAHAIAAELMGGRIAEVRILRQPGRSKDKLGFLAYSRRDNRAPMTLMGATFTCAAGNAADHRFGYFTPRQWSTGDYERMQAAGFCGYDIALIDGLMQLWLKVPVVARCVDSVARALVKKDLSGADVRRIIKREMRKK